MSEPRFLFRYRYRASDKVRTKWVTGREAREDFSGWLAKNAADFFSCRPMGNLS